ncbi:MAG TPA: superoxide dismutase [Lacibacter sp.]|nr:superoxide dismutase [Lacibacter sp.]HMO88867.1 superoxide dismutase [Lacibacter sp.]HMP85935.1 superoxide dismutase [Lacibacter sp.]
MSDFGFAQSPLPYAYHALEPVVDARTMEIHYSKHAAAYAANLQDAAKAEGVAPGQSLQQLLGQVQKYSAKLRNNGGGHYNHELFWRCMKPGGGTTPAGSLREAIHQSFGSLEAMQQQFNDAAKGQFGSGWAWLYADAGKQLRIGATPNQDNPLMPVSAVRGTPLLGLDVWEHAYYLQYQNRRADYVNAWWKVVNWAYVEERFGLL